MGKPYIDFGTLKATVSVTQVLEHYGLMATMRSTKNGESLEGPCPIHKGTNPDQFKVSVSKNCWNCFSECKGGGNVLDFVARMENVDVHEAAVRLNDWFKLGLGSSPSGERTNRSRDATSPKPAVTSKVATGPPADAPTQAPPEEEHSAEACHNERRVRRFADRAVEVEHLGRLFEAVRQFVFRSLVRRFTWPTTDVADQGAVGKRAGIILMLDEDDAGRAGREKALTRLSRRAFVRVAVLPREGAQPDHLSDPTHPLFSLGRLMTTPPFPHAALESGEPDPEWIPYEENLIEVRMLLPDGLKIDRHTMEPLLAKVSLCRHLLCFEIVGSSEQVVRSSW